MVETMSINLQDEINEGQTLVNIGLKKIMAIISHQQFIINQQADELKALKEPPPPCEHPEALRQIIKSGSTFTQKHWKCQGCGFETTEERVREPGIIPQVEEPKETEAADGLSMPQG